MIEALRRTWVRFAVLGAVAYLVFLVATLPSAWLGYALERASGGALALGDTRGTVWKGQGALAARIKDGYRGIADIEWRVIPSALLTGKLGVALTGTGPGADLKANVSFGARSVSLQNVQASIPATLLEPVDPAVAFAKPQGRVRVNAESLEIGRASVRGTATADWSEAGLGGVARIGDYRLQVSGNGDSATLRLATLRGDLRLNGNGEWRAAQPRVVQLRGVAETSPERKDLEPLLGLIAGGGSGPSRPFGWMMTL